MTRKLVIGALLVLVVMPAASEAQEARRRGVSGPVVQSITISGNTYFSDKRIKGVMRTEESKFLRTRRLRETTLENDLHSIEALYTRNGFLHVTVATDTIIYDDNRENVRIEIEVKEGTQTTVGEVVFEGNVAIRNRDLLKAIRLREGAPLNQREMDEDAYRLYSYYADRGFVFASISPNVVATNGEATVTFKIAEGREAVIDEISVRGNSRVSAPIITREVMLEKGDVFSGKKVVNSQQNILDTGLFKDVEIEPRPGAPDSATVDLVVKVKERKLREVSLAVGYGTRDETRLTTGWMHRNLWKSARQFEVRAVLASRDFDKGLTRKRGDMALTDRWLFRRKLVGALAFYAEETLEEYKEVTDGEYTLDRYGLNISIKKDLPKETQLMTAYTHEFVDVRDPSWSPEETEDLRLEVGQEVNRAATVTVERDTRKPFFEPLGGSITRLSARRAGGMFGGDNSYNKITWSWSRYFRFYFGSIIAISSRCGYADAYGGSRDKGVPEYERFCAGGSGTIRGYDEREFGPGDFLLLANLEVRYHLFWKLAGVCFLDMGNAWGSIKDVTRSDFDLFVPSEEYGSRRAGDVKYSVGVGVGVQTPVGPARVDYGLRIKRGVDSEGNKESLGRIHLTVGHAF
jgi:outer membrane protein insertion porin family